MQLNIPDPHPLKEILRSKKVHQVQVAAKLGISLSSLNHYLNGYRQAPPEIQRQLETLAAELKEHDIAG